jgi:poly(A) polymerase/tRNA nucleotidyltransferase (CCA-adding enzyme)
VGKPQCAEPSREDAGRQTFYGHENLSSEMANTILTRLRFPNATVKRVCLLIENHMFSYEPCWSDAAVRRFLSRLNLNSNPGILNSLFDLRRADAFALENHPQTCKNLDAFEERIEQILSQDGALSLKDLEVNGKDLIQMGITNGIKIGWTLNELLNTVLDSPEMNQKEKLLNLAKNLNNL